MTVEKWFSRGHDPFDTGPIAQTTTPPALQAPPVSLLLGEDARHLFLWKPPGIPVFPPHADPAGDCLLARLLAERPERAAGWPPGFEGGIAHRLDTATSGLVVAARTPADLAPLRAEFAGGGLRKLYIFWSDAPAPFREQVRTDPIAHHPNRKDRMVTRRGPRTAHRGRWYDAWTRFTHRGGGWWEAEIRTGVMHQIRVHAAAAGIPLAGDPQYAATPPAHPGSAPEPPEPAAPEPAAPRSDAPRTPPPDRGTRNPSPGRFILHHVRMVGAGWASPAAPLPDDVRGPDVLVRP